MQTRSDTFSNHPSRLRLEANQSWDRSAGRQFKCRTSPVHFIFIHFGNSARLSPAQISHPWSFSPSLNCESFSFIVHFGVLTTIANMLQFPGLGAKVNGCFSCCLFASPFQLSLSFFISFFHSAHSPQQDMPQGTSKMCCNCLVLSFSFPFLRPYLLLRP